jgi:hypothetical protein
MRTPRESAHRVATKVAIAFAVRGTTRPPKRAIRHADARGRADRAKSTRQWRAHPRRRPSWRTSSAEPRRVSMLQVTVRERGLQVEDREQADVLAQVHEEGHVQGRLHDPRRAGTADGGTGRPATPPESPLFDSPPRWSWQRARRRGGPSRRADCGGARSDGRGSSRSTSAALGSPAGLPGCARRWRVSRCASRRAARLSRRRHPHTPLATPRVATPLSAGRHPYRHHVSRA